MNNIYKNLFYPSRCAACDEVLELDHIDSGFCSSCERTVRYAFEPVCKICGKVVAASSVELCDDCAKKRHFFIQSKGVYVYEGAIKTAMYRFKYSNRRDLADTFTRDCISMYAGWIEARRIEAIIPVPMHRRKKRLRGYNQAELIADRLGKRLGIEVYHNLVTRGRATTPMKGLNDTERQKNLKNAFIYHEKGIQLKRVLVVDDIYTTGTTLDSVAGILLRAGVQEVYGLCLCVGRGYSDAS